MNRSTGVLLISMLLSLLAARPSIAAPSPSSAPPPSQPGFNSGAPAPRPVTGNPALPFINGQINSAFSPAAYFNAGFGGYYGYAGYGGYGSGSGEASTNQSNQVFPSESPAVVGPTLPALRQEQFVGRVVSCTLQSLTLNLGSRVVTLSAGRGRTLPTRPLPGNLVVAWAFQSGQLTQVTVVNPAR